MTTLINTEAQTVNTATMFHALNDSIEFYDIVHGNLHGAFIDREKCLNALIESGITAIQSGKNANSKNPVVLPNQLAYSIAKSDYNARFLAKNPNASIKQIADNLKQKIAGLQVFLTTGTFLNNVGRDKPALEYDLAFKKSETSAMLAYQAKKNLNASNKIAEQSKLEATRQQAAVVAQQKLAAAAKNAKDKKDADEKLARLQETSRLANIKKIEDEKQAVINKALSDAAIAKKAKEALDTQAKKDALKPKPKAPIVAPLKAKVIESDNTVSKNAGCSEECKLEALELMAEFEENHVPASVLRELAKLINIKYPVSK